MLGNIGSVELFVIMLAVLLIFGSKRIPEIARGLGSGIREFRAALREISVELQNENRNIHRATDLRTGASRYGQRATGRTSERSPSASDGSTTDWSPAAEMSPTADRSPSTETGRTTDWSASTETGRTSDWSPSTETGRPSGWSPTEAEGPSDAEFTNGHHGTRR